MQVFNKKKSFIDAGMDAGKWLFSHPFLFIPVKIVERGLTHACVFFSGDEQKRMGEEQFGPGHV